MTRWKDPDWPEPPYEIREAHEYSVRRKLARLSDQVTVLSMIVIGILGAILWETLG